MFSRNCNRRTLGLGCFRCLLYTLSLVALAYQDGPMSWGGGGGGRAEGTVCVLFNPLVPKRYLTEDYIFKRFWSPLPPAPTPVTLTSKTTLLVRPPPPLLLPVRLHFTCTILLPHPLPLPVRLQLTCITPLPRLPPREAGDVWCLPPVWNLRAVIWFHFAISSLVLLPSPVTLSFLSFFCLLVFSSELFQKILRNGPRYQRVLAYVLF